MLSSASGSSSTAASPGPEENPLEEPGNPFGKAANPFDAVVAGGASEPGAAAPLQKTWVDDVLTPLADVQIPLLADLQGLFGEPKPRNPRHFDSIEGGRKRVSDTFTHKNSDSSI